MSINLDELKRQHEFEFETEALGRLKCRSISTKSFKILEELLADESLTGRHFIVNILTQIAVHISDDEQESQQVTIEEANQLTDDEIESFAKEFLAHNNWILMTYEVASSNVVTDENGNRVVSRTPQKINLPKILNETDSDYLIRVIRHYLDIQRQRIEELTKPLSGFFKNLKKLTSTQDAIRNNFFISDKLKELSNLSEKFHRNLDFGKTDIAASIDPIRPLELPESPIIETNRRLNKVIDYIDEIYPLVSESAKLISSMNDVSIRMLANYGRNAQRTERFTYIMIIIATISLVITAGFSYINYTSRNISTVQTAQIIDKFSDEIASLSDSQDQKTERLISEFQEFLADQVEKDSIVQREILKEIVERTEQNMPQSIEQLPPKTVDHDNEEHKQRLTP